tara:strand:+ start:3767 stop:5854 length:2088 start_codon:yes stop_codon:yes gene_type:complete
MKNYPPDYTCRFDNPNAIFDETIIEVCDGIDNNCNCIGDTNNDLIVCGYGDEGVDEGCICWPQDVSWANDERRTCWPNDLYPRNMYTVSETFRLRGECKDGFQVCRQLPEGGSEWGYYQNDVDWVPNGCADVTVPATEVCDGLDNNCDGKIDESLKRSCWSGPQNNDGMPQDWIAFYDAREAPSTPCKQGIQTCQEGSWSGCLYEVLPSEELCNGIDDNCNGIVDDHARGEGENCGLTNDGICEYGQFECVASVNGQGADLECKGASLPEVEVCDNYDNNCDGKIDEELLQPCETLCGSGFERCVAGTWVGCTAQQPMAEICDGIDNDCNGLVDENLECSCSPDLIDVLIPCRNNPVITCGLGYLTCECDNEDCSKTYFTDCEALCVHQPQVQDICDPLLGIPENEVCNNWDDDCDGLIDEDLNRVCYTGAPGTRDVGVCVSGIQLCSVGRWGNFTAQGIFIDDYCVDEILPSEEVCDHLDNDCDGEIDEDLNSHEKVDMVFVIDRSGSMCSKINALKQGIQPYILEFADTEHKFAVINVPGDSRRDMAPPNVLVNLVDTNTFNRVLNNIDCNLGAIEPQYDAVFGIATNNEQNAPFELQFRDDAWPMIIVLTDEVAQSFNGITSEIIRNELTPCKIGICEQDDTLEVFAIVPQAFQNEWCAPANIAKKCYNLYNEITSAEIRSYLDDIFIDVCR